jgi:putative ABC transport system substrate-binding protein
MNRRAFISLLGGAVAASPLAARAQQPVELKRVGILMGFAESDVVAQTYLAAFRQTFQQLGWTTGRDVRIDTRWAAADADLNRRYAAELVALSPDVILATLSPTVAALRATTRTIPIVFAQTIDPVGSGFVESLARPGGNITGFTPFEYGMSGKWVELLKDIAPGVRRVAVLRDPGIAPGIGQLGAIQSVAPTLGVELSPVNLSEADELERAIAAFARAPDGAMIVTASPLAARHRELIIGLAAKHKLPAIYYERPSVVAGGLMSYAPDRIQMYRLAAAYVDRVLKGEKPADLPVQTPTKYELVLNLKTAKALGLSIPAMLLARADEVIE